MRMHMAHFWNKTKSFLQTLTDVIVLPRSAVLALLMLTSVTAQARTNDFLAKTIREYEYDPSPGNKTKLERAQTEAKILDYAVIGVPVFIVAVFAVGYLSRRQRRK